MSENYINHIALVLDASLSMSHLTSEVIKVADNQIAHLASRSQELDQETRVSVYTFNDNVQCVIFDKDVLRLPSIKQVYKAGGNTALIDATIKSQDDLEDTSQLYGDHAFLTYVLTDGEENRSKTPNKFAALQKRLLELPDNWTVAVFVPDQTGKHEAKRFGFPPDNIAIWDSTSVRGMESAGDVIKQATDDFMQARSTGNFRGTRGLFNMSSANLNKNTVKSSLQEISKAQYKLLNVDAEGQISEFVRQAGMPYRLGCAYYQLMKSEEIQPQKQICILEKKTKKVYSGRVARDVLGLPDYKIKVRPDYNPEYDVFVQSTSVNRKLVPGTKLLVMK